MIKSIRNHGFSLTFDNGFTVSVQYGRAHACERLNTHNRGKPHDDLAYEEIESFTAEVTVTDRNKNAVIFDGSVSLCFQNAKEVADILFKASIAKMPSDLHDFDIAHIHKVESWE